MGTLGLKTPLCGDMEPLGNNSRPSREGTRIWDGAGVAKPRGRLSQSLRHCSHSVHTGPYTADAHPLFPGHSIAPGEAFVHQDGGLPGLRLWDPPSLQVSEQGTWVSEGQADL